MKQKLHWPIFISLAAVVFVLLIAGSCAVVLQKQVSINKSQRSVSSSDQKLKLITNKNSLVPSSEQGIFGRVYESGVGTVPQGVDSYVSAETPVVGRDIKVETRAGLIITSTVTGSDGKYRVTLPPGDYQICDLPPTRACGDYAYKFTVEVGQYFEHNFNYLRP